MHECIVSVLPSTSTTNLNPPTYTQIHLPIRCQGTFVSGAAMDGKVKVTFTGTQVPMEVEVSEEALGAGAAALSAALTEAMKEGHAKSVQLQQQKLTCVLWIG